jgi:hypothetical protein
MMVDQDQVKGLKMALIPDIFPVSSELQVEIGRNSPCIRKS